MTQRAGPPQEDVSRPLVDPGALRRWLDETLGPGPDIEVERHQVGHSNETFLVTRGLARWVLRRPPRGAFLPTAHDVMREHRVLSALADTPVRTPRPVAACEDTAVIGVPFYLMERIDGIVIRERLPEAFSDESDRRAIGEQLVDSLVELHAVDPSAVGLEGFGKLAGYLARQLRRWSGQLELTEPFSRTVSDLHRVREWLGEHVPKSGPETIVHGDYKLDNVAYAAAPPARLVAIFDWEMSTLGDPLADLGWMLSFWREAGDELDGELEVDSPTRLPGFRSRSELVARYEERSGRAVHDLEWYVTLAIWKLAILLEGSYARHLAGLTDDPFFAELEHGVPMLAARAFAVARGGVV